MADTSAPVVLIQGSVYAGAVVGICILVPMSIATDLILLPIGVVVFALMALGINVGLRQHKSKPIVITPSSIVYYSWYQRLEVPWQDVASLTVAGYEPKSWIGKGFVAIFFGRRGYPPCVSVRLRRGRLVGFMPNIRVLALYPAEPEKFVQEAQRYLTPAVG